MKKVFFSIFILTGLSACKQDSKNEFQISGVLKNTNAKMVYLQETPLITGQRILVDSSVIGKDGSYSVKANRTEESLFHLFVDKETYPFAVLVNDDSKIKVNADLSLPNSYEVEGSPAGKAIKDFSVSAGKKWTDLNSLGVKFDSLQKSGAPDSVLFGLNNEGQKLLEDLKNYIKDFAKNSSSPIASYLALGSYPQLFSPEEYQEILNELVKKFPAHKGIAGVKAKYDEQVALLNKNNEQTSATKWVGKEAPELVLPDLNGNEIKLSSLRGKYVLVDFWASWCGPCRRENPNIVNAYNKHRNKNFTILGVSLDRDKDAWLKAIKKDKLDWPHVSDLKDWSSIAVSTYGFNSIPFNVLLDPTGKVIAESLRGDELDARLEELLK